MLGLWLGEAEQAELDVAALKAGELEVLKPSQCPTPCEYGN